MCQFLLVRIYKVVVDSQNFQRGFILKSFFLLSPLDGLVFCFFNQHGLYLESESNWGKILLTDHLTEG